MRGRVVGVERPFGSVGDEQIEIAVVVVIEENGRLRMADMNQAGLAWSRR